MSPIAISAYASISASGSLPEKQLAAYRSGQTHLSWAADKSCWVGAIPIEQEILIEALKAEYPRLDRTALLAIYAGRQAMQKVNWQEGDFGIQIGSSRGATGLWEDSHQRFQKSGRVRPTSSPLSTLGNISSWLGQDLGQQGWRAEHSVTCSTAAHAIVQAAAWLRSGMAKRFLAGGTEAPLTPFTLAQMQVMRIYSKAEQDHPWPCRPFIQDTENGMVLGEGAAVFCLDSKPENKPLAWITGIGYAQEKISSPTSVDANGAGIKQAMQMALHAADLERVDLIVSHSPGTRKGDAAELIAINSVFKQQPPAITNSKWLHGHCLGTSAGLSLELALLALDHPDLGQLPYNWAGSVKAPEVINTILINALGFGGNCVSLVISR